MNPELTYIFDIDGTLTSSRYENDNVLDVEENKAILGLALAVANSPWLGRLAIVTARPSYLLKDTQTWLRLKGLDCDVLLMRGNGDPRPDHEVRVDQVKEIMNSMGKTVVLFDDKFTNCLAVRSSLGVPCIHIKEP